SARKFELYLTVWPGGGEACPIAFVRLQKFTAFGIIDRTPIVRIDEGQVPKLCSLVKVRHAWQRRLEHELRQGIQRAQQGSPPGKLFERTQKARRDSGIKQPCDKAEECGLVGFIRVSPAGFLFSFARCLQGVSLDSAGKV